MDKETQKDAYLFGTIKALRASQQRYIQNPVQAVKVCEKAFIIDRGVFPSYYFADTRFFVDNMPDPKGKNVLEIGCGAGIISVMMALKGAKKVVATDVSSDALDNTSRNAQRHGVQEKIDTRQGSVYLPLGKGQKFDIILWNMPFGYVEFFPRGLEDSVFDYKYNHIRDFFRGARKHLSENGRLVYEFSPTIGRPDLISNYLKENHLVEKPIVEETFSRGVMNPNGDVYLGLYEARREEE